jgi:rRNA maturation RNase YbeY
MFCQLLAVSLFIKVILFTLNCEGQPDPNKIFCKDLGDIYFGVDYAFHKWCDGRRERLPWMLSRLVVHGYCHLIGYDHETDEDFEVMSPKELELLELLKSRRLLPSPHGVNVHEI